jgi:hypothetical protein
MVNACLVDSSGRSCFFSFIFIVKKRILLSKAFLMMLFSKKYLVELYQKIRKAGAKTTKRKVYQTYP